MTTIAVPGRGPAGEYLRVQALRNMRGVHREALAILWALHLRGTDQVTTQGFNDPHTLGVSGQVCARLRDAGYVTRGPLSERWQRGGTRVWLTEAGQKQAEQEYRNQTAIR